MIPYDNAGRPTKNYSHSSLTYMILFTAFLMGYSYARLSQDEYTRRAMYIRYSNLMLGFDRFHNLFDSNYTYARNSIYNFDHKYYYWYFKNLKIQEWREYKKREKEVHERQARDDQLSTVINQMDELGEGEDISERKERLKMKL